MVQMVGATGMVQVVGASGMVQMVGASGLVQVVGATGLVQAPVFRQKKIRQEFLSESVSVGVDVTHVLRVVEGHFPSVIVQLDFNFPETLLHCDDFCFAIRRLTLVRSSDRESHRLAVFGSRMMGLKWTLSFIFSQTLKDRLPRAASLDSSSSFRNWWSLLNSALICFSVDDTCFVMCPVVEGHVPHVIVQLDSDPLETLLFIKCLTITIGKHSWDVEVGDHPRWAFGLAKESVDRKGELHASPKYGIWCLLHRDGKYTYGVGETLRVQKSLQRIRVHLDYDMGKVSFYDSEDMTHIYTHRDTFTEKLFPYFNVSPAERNTNTGTVFGSEGFSSGKHSWDVEVGDHPDWTLGVVKESAERKGERLASPKYGIWSLWHGDGKYTNTLGEIVPLKKRLQRIKVQLDYDMGTISFYDSEDMTHIYTHRDTFTEKLFPYFGVRRAGIEAPFSFSENKSASSFREKLMDGSSFEDRLQMGQFLFPEEQRVREETAESSSRTMTQGLLRCVDGGGRPLLTGCSFESGPWRGVISGLRPSYSEDGVNPADP
ncbi:hypothetical protein CCH79_00013277 [Gambusia affinis]|uniref:B30.2/SPRY domain-containing protein n=1 Tax=Gambusia affinis TaxID=33528 RepID=A0A315VDK8_GAMAF|nr:hypothetical protein CCH79_00013277 [Gambusia affinis]